MRVAYVVCDPGVPVFGTKGASVHVQEVVRALRAAGCEVSLFARRVGGPPPADLSGVPLTELPALAGAGAERERAAFDGNDAVADAVLSGGAFDLLYERHALFSFGALEAAARRGIPALLEVNAPLVEEQRTHRGLAEGEAAERASRRAFAAASALLAVSKEVAAYLSAFVETRGKIHVVPNGVDPRRFEDVPSLRARRAERRTVGFLGTLKPWHGVPVLVEAFARVAGRQRDARLLVVGDGPERKTLERDLAERGLSAAARVTGAVAPAEVPALLAQMDLGVAPYADAAGFYFSPLKVYEYMAAGLPVVTSRIGQLEDVVRHGETGLLCEPGDAASLAAAVERLLAEPELATRLGNAGRAKALAEHTWDAVAGTILRLAAA